MTKVWDPHVLQTSSLAHSPPRGLNIRQMPFRLAARSHPRIVRNTRQSRQHCRRRRQRTKRAPSSHTTAATTLPPDPRLFSAAPRSPFVSNLSASTAGSMPPRTPSSSISFNSSPSPQNFSSNQTAPASCSLYLGYEPPRIGTFRRNPQTSQFVYEACRPLSVLLDDPGRGRFRDRCRRACYIRECGGSCGGRLPPKDVR